MTAPPQNPPAAFKPGDPVRVKSCEVVGTVSAAYKDWITVDWPDMPTGAPITHHINELEPAPPPAAADDGLRERVARDCEVCGGDCAGANPPVYNCPLQNESTVIEPCEFCSDGWAEGRPHPGGYVPYARCTACDGTGKVELTSVPASRDDDLEEARTLIYDLKYAAAGGEDVPGSANAVTVADVERWQREGERQVRDLEARLTGAESRATRAEAECERMKGERDSAVEALEPFAKASEDFDIWDDPNAGIYPLFIEHAEGGADFHFKLADLRRASSTLAAIKGETT